MSAHENEKEEAQAPAPDADAGEEHKAAGEPALPDMESRTEPALAPSDAESGQSEDEVADITSNAAWPPGGMDLVLKLLPLPEGLPPGQREVWVGVRPNQASLAATLFRLFRLEELEPFPERLQTLIRECISHAAANEVSPQTGSPSATTPELQEEATTKGNEPVPAKTGQAVNSEAGAEAGRSQQVLPRKGEPDSPAARQLTLF
ncbi:MAG TPA: hypothetical protein VH186_34770 [Chloroflexia bacterium]|nr:hypothetical protein [Chloroflexia bacterium]